MSSALININDPVCRRGREHRPISRSSLDSKSSIEDSTNGRKAEDRLCRSKCVHIIRRAVWICKVKKEIRNLLEKMNSSMSR